MGLNTWKKVGVLQDGFTGGLKVKISRGCSSTWSDGSCHAETRCVGRAQKLPKERLLMSDSWRRSKGKDTLFNQGFSGFESEMLDWCEMILICGLI